MADKPKILPIYPCQPSGLWNEKDRELFEGFFHQTPSSSSKNHKINDIFADERFTELRQQYLNKFANESMNKLFSSIFYLLEYVAVSFGKPRLNLILNVVENELYHNNKIQWPKSLEKNHGFDKNLIPEDYFERFFELHLEVLNFYHRMCRYLKFDCIKKVFPFIQLAMAERWQLTMKRINLLMIQTKNQELQLERMFELLFTESACFPTYHPEKSQFILDSLLIVFIKCESSFRIIYRNEQNYQPSDIFSFVNQLDQFLLDQKKLFECHKRLGLVNSVDNIGPPLRDQRMIKKFLNRFYLTYDPKLVRDAERYTPNFLETRHWETLAYLIKSRYRNKTISQDAFFELSQRLIEGTPVIHGRFMASIRRQGQMEELYYKKFLQEYKLKNDRMLTEPNFDLIIKRDWLLKSIYSGEDPNKIVLSIEDEFSIINQKKILRKHPYYFGHPNKDFNIHFVHSEFSLQNMILDLQHYQVIALDAEWLPVFTYRRQTIAILQISTTDACYVLDLVNFKERNLPYRQLFYEFVQKYLHQPNVLKVGFGIGQDIEILRYSTGIKELKLVNQVDLCKSSRSLIQFLSKLPSKHNSYLLSKQIQRSKQVLRQQKQQQQQQFRSQNYDSDSGTSSRLSTFKDDRVEASSIPQGLSLFTYVMFGKQLDKSEQQSDWTSRPLRLPQLLYAALDSYCLIDIYKQLQILMEQLNFNDLVLFLSHVQMVAKADDN